VGVLFLVLGGLALVSAWVPAGETAIRYWRLDALLAVTGVALLTRSRAWRNAALVVNIALTALSIGQTVAALPFVGRLFPNEPGFPAAPDGLGLSLVLAVLQTLAFVAGLRILWRRDVRRSFGLGEQGEMTQPAGVDPGTVRLSKRAVASFILVLVSLVLALPTVLPVPRVVMMMSDRRMGAVAFPGVLVFGGLGLLTIGPAVVGTVLGMIAWSDIRHTAGRLRGRAFAIIGTLTWPVIVLLLGPLGFLSVTFLKLQATGPSAARPVGIEASDSGVLLGYQIPAGQAA
jgi:hypothetical protein